MKKKVMSEKNKKVLNIVLTVVQIIIVLIAVIASITIIVNPGATTVGKTSTSLLPVMSDSMVGPNKDNFRKGDLVVSKKPDGKKWDAYDLKEDDIITFTNSENRVITHRIYKVIDAGTPNVRYITKGDNNAHVDTDPAFVAASQVLGIYKTHHKGTGKTILWLQTPKNFLLVIILPLAILFIYNIVVFVKMIMDNKIAKATEKAGGATAGMSEDEIKQKIIDEYLAKQQSESTKAEVAEESVSDVADNKVEESANDVAKEDKEVVVEEKPEDNDGKEK